MVYAGLSPLGIVGADLPREQLHKAVTEIIRQQEEVVRAYLLQHKKELQAAAEHLLQYESISGDQLRNFLTKLAS